MIRTFIALDINDDVRAAIKSCAADLQRDVPDRAVRWVKPESIHLTLKFLGDVYEKTVPDIKAGLEAAAAQVRPFRMNVAELGCFPNERRPRVIWVGVQEGSGALKALFDALEKQMSDLGFDPERRKFHPHLTLGRVRRSASRSEVHEVARVLQSDRIGPLGAVDCSQVHLYQSDLRPSGAVYSRLASAGLGGER